MGFLRLSLEIRQVECLILIYMLNDTKEEAIIFGTPGDEQMRINNVGNVGIGTSSPNTYTKLDVNGMVAATWI